MALEHHGDPVGDFQELVEVGRYHHDRHAAIGAGDDPVMGEAGVLEIEAIGRLVEDRDARLGIQLAGQQDLLDIAAGEAPERAFSPKVSECRCA